MQNTIEFMTAMLQAVADFLTSEPVYYIMTFLLASIVISVMKNLMRG